MHQAVLLWVEYAKHRVGYVPGLSILEVGSANWNGSPRHLFTDAKHYTGIDIHPAKDVI